jgi:RPA family protein
MAEEQNKRKVAKKLLIKDILSSTYIKRPGWEPSGVLTRFGEASRVNIMGITVSIEDDENRPTILLDDGSGTIQIRLFENQEQIKNYALGDLLMVIGRPREFESTKYIVPEIIKTIEDKKWFKAHQLELQLQQKTGSIELPIEPEQLEEQEIEAGPYQKILNIIAILDKGSGADVQDIVNHVKISNCEQLINSLIAEGEIFEITPGKVKLLG